MLGSGPLTIQSLSDRIDRDNTANGDKQVRILLAAENLTASEQRHYEELHAAVGNLTNATTNLCHTQEAYYDELRASWINAGSSS